MKCPRNPNGDWHTEPMHRGACIFCGAVPPERRVNERAEMQRPKVGAKAFGGFDARKRAAGDDT